MNSPETQSRHSVQRTCWATGAVIRMCGCGTDKQPVSPCLPVCTDGRDEWAYCPTCKKTWDTRTLKEWPNDKVSELAPAAGSAAALRREIAQKQEQLRQRMKVERTERVASTRWGATVYKLRVARGMSCSELARACGMTPAYVTTIETGKKHNPTLAAVERLASAFGIKASEVVKLYEQEPQPNEKLSV